MNVYPKPGLMPKGPNKAIFNGVPPMNNQKWGMSMILKLCLIISGLTLILQSCSRHDSGVDVTKEPMSNSTLVTHMSSSPTPSISATPSPKVDYRKHPYNLIPDDSKFTDVQRAMVYVINQCIESINQRNLENFLKNFLPYDNNVIANAEHYYNYQVNQNSTYTINASNPSFRETIKGKEMEVTVSVKNFSLSNSDKPIEQTASYVFNKADKEWKLHHID